MMLFAFAALILLLVHNPELFADCRDRIAYLLYGFPYIYLRRTERLRPVPHLVPLV
jgi:hypothetical protein